MTSPLASSLQPDTVIEGPFWSGPVRVIRASQNGSAVRIEAVGVVDSHYYDRTIPADQANALIQEVSGGTHTFDAEPRLFRLAVEALRTYMAHAFDPQFAVSVSQVDPLPHQLDAVYGHILQLPRIRFLLADDPGAGKTIMAGLLMRELMQRGEVSRVLVLCPKALTDQWRREMWERFREPFVLVTGDLISGSFGQNAWVENDLVVASVDLAIQDHILPRRRAVAVGPHHLRRGPQTLGVPLRTQDRQDQALHAGRTVGRQHQAPAPDDGDAAQGRPRELPAAPLPTRRERVSRRRRAPRSVLDKDGSPYFLRRMKESMKDFDGRPLFLPRHVDTLAYELEPHEQQLYDAVTDYVSEGLAQAEEVGNRNVTLALIVLQRRLASSLYAAARSLERRRDRLTEELEHAGRSSRSAQRAMRIDYDPEEDDLDELTSRGGRCPVRRFHRADTRRPARRDSQAKQTDSVGRGDAAEGTGTQTERVPTRHREPDRRRPQRKDTGLHRAPRHADLPDQAAPGVGIQRLQHPRRDEACRPYRCGEGVPRPGPVHGGNRGSRRRASTSSSAR